MESAGEEYWGITTIQEDGKTSVVQPEEGGGREEERGGRGAGELISLCKFVAVVSGLC